MYNGELETPNAGLDVSIKNKYNLAASLFGVGLRLLAHYPRPGGPDNTKALLY